MVKLLLRLRWQVLLRPSPSLLTARQAYSISAGLIKISFLLQYLRLLVVDYGHKRCACSALICLVVAWTLSQLATTIFACSPIQKSWQIDLPGTCISVKSSIIAHSAIGFLFNLCIFALPVRELWGLRLPLLRRVGLIVFFGSGIVYVLFFLLVVRQQRSQEPISDSNGGLEQVYLVFYD